MEIKESKIYLGFYEIPYYSNYVISKEGVVLFKPLGRPLKGSINPAGYVNIRIKDDLGKTLTWGLHRLLCYVFKHPNKPIINLVINHIDGNKSNNNLDNLEWTTYLGNMYHAGANNLTSKCTPFLVRDINTGIVEKYPSAVDYARKTGLSKDAVLWRLKKGVEYVFPENKQYKRGLKEPIWPSEYELIYLNGNNFKPLKVKNVLTGKITTYNKISDMANDFDISPSTATTWINKKNQPVLPGYIQLKWQSDKTDWRIVKDPYQELKEFENLVSVKLIQESTNEEIIFNSCVDCAKFLNISPNVLNYRLKKKQNKFLNGYKYFYLNNYFLKGPVI